jgi:hypothetical protein
MKYSWLIAALTAGYCSLTFGNILTNETTYNASFDIHQTKIGSTNSRLLGASWVLEKPIGIFYGGGLRILASPVDGFSANARQKSLSLFYMGPMIGWSVAFHPFVGLEAHVLYGIGSVSYSENTGIYNADNTQQVKTQDSRVQFLEPAINIRLGSYNDMQAVLGGGTRILLKNAHSDRTPDSALGKPFIQLGVNKKMSGI